ncbi:MAG: hypothetical protein KGS60_02830 [Verrucomicrobia bacterium]|nr:hypothetical protein [Verrucomicrobiota bacterium]
MRRAIVMFLLAFGFPGSGWAKDPVPEDPSHFGTGFELGVFGGGAIPDGSGSGEFGGGVSLAYFFTPEVGIDASYGVFAFEDEIHTVSADVVLRYPISEASIAPYLVIGGGARTNGDSAALYRLGGGLDVRFQPGGPGIFADGIYNWVVGQENFTVARLGVRIPF